MKKFLPLFLLSFLLIKTLSFSQSIVSAPYYKMVSWDSSPYKSFKLTGGTANPNYNMTFRLLWPKGYDSSSVTQYPLVLMLHGGGESALGNAKFGVYPDGDPRKFNNDNQLLHQGKEYLAAVNNGKWPGFVLFPQNNYGDWLNSPSTLADAIEIVLTLCKTLKIDENRIYIAGLSNGAQGVWAALARYPTIFASALPYSGISLPTADNTTKVVTIPIWYFQGEVDNNPPKTTADKTMQALINAGGTPVYTVYPETGHNTWVKAIAEPDFFPFLLRYSKLSIHSYFGKTDFDKGETVNQKLAITPGFSGYEWRKDGVLISGANTNQITATSLGSYTVRFRRGTVWTPWSAPLVLKLKTPPSIVSQPVTIVKTAGQAAPFSVTVSGTAPFTYQWQKDGVNIPGATAQTYRIPNALTSDAGYYRVIVTNELGSATSNYAKLSVKPALAVSIDNPVASSFYVQGQTVTYTGNGNDSKGATLPASAFTWKLEYYKAGYTTIWTRSGSKTGTYTIPVTGETSTSVFYRFTLTVKDPTTGTTKSLTRDIKPKTSEVVLATEPYGLKVTVNGSTKTTNYAFQGVEGSTRTIGVVSPQTINGVTYKFSKWLQGGTASQTISVPSNDVTYTAVFVSDKPTHSSIDAPAAGTYYRGGETIAYSGSAVDGQGNPLSGSAFSWKLEFHKTTGTLSLWTRSGSTSGSFSIPTSGETSTDVFYRLILNLTYPDGTKETLTRDIPPYTSKITLATQPTGLKVNLDSKAYVGPYSFLAVEGRTRSIGAVSPQTLNGKTYTFSHWSQGGSATQTITVPQSDVTYTAVYVESSTARLAGSDSESHLELFPNPSVDYVRFNVEASKAGEVFHVSIINSLGRQVKQLPLKAPNEGMNSFVIDVSDLNSNSYTLRVFKGKKSYYKHFIINK